MHGLSLIYVMREIAGIKTFRITQEKLTSFKVQIVRDEKYEPRSEERIRNSFMQRLKSPVDVGISYLESIPPTPSGKTQHIISEVSLPSTVDWPISGVSGDAKEKLN
jgi:phenylacetate-CoA ligase